MPLICGIRASTRNNATAALRCLSSRTASSAWAPEPAFRIRYSAAKCLRRSRSTAFRTSGSSSTVRMAGFVAKAQAVRLSLFGCFRFGVILYPIGALIAAESCRARSGPIASCLKNTNASSQPWAAIFCDHSAISPFS